MGEPDEGSQQFESIAEHCERTKNNKPLIVTTEFDVKTPVMSGYFARERAEIFARYGIKVSEVSFVGRTEQSEQIDLGKFAALATQNAGVKVEVFTDFQAVEEWRLEDPPQWGSASRMRFPCD